MKSRTLKHLALVATLALGLSACVIPMPGGETPSGRDNDIYLGEDAPTTVEVVAEMCADGNPVSVVYKNKTYSCVATSTDGNPSGGSDVTAPEPAGPVGECSKDSLTASHDDNLSSGRYEMSYFGGSSENCFMFGEFNFGYARQTWLIVVPPGYTLNLAGFIGETTWYRESEGAVNWSIEDSTANLTRKDGRNEKTPIVVWANDPASLKLLPKEAKFEVIPPAK